MKAFEIIAYVSRKQARKTEASTCSCGMVRLGYQPERKTGAVIHGALVCRREKP